MLVRVTLKPREKDHYGEWNWDHGDDATIDTEIRRRVAHLMGVTASQFLHRDGFIELRGLSAHDAQKLVHDYRGSSVIDVSHPVVESWEAIQAYADHIQRIVEGTPASVVARELLESDCETTFLCPAAADINPPGSYELTRDKKKRKKRFPLDTEKPVGLGDLVQYQGAVDRGSDSNPCLERRNK